VPSDERDGRHGLEPAFEQERQVVFREGPIVACLSPDVRDAGMFATVVSGGIAVLAVRGEDGELRAFSNTCRHGAPMVVAEREGPGQHAANAFTCPFADWPDAHSTGAGVVRPLPVAEAHGLVTVRAGGGAPVDPDAAIGPDPLWLDSLGLDRYRREHAVRAVRSAPWRTAFAELLGRPGARAVGPNAAMTAAPDSVELHRVFPLTPGECVVDVARYRRR
jgi:phenylpropionate dioxygenase-like ring-hydroxylating dioxygenase large terminal subunit